MDFRSENNFSNIPLVTIGVLSYNYSKYILDALNSLLTQTYPFIELIIVDDCSTDNCDRIISEWIGRNNVHCVYIRNQRNLGITATSNIIVKQAKGKYITLFATDDIMLPDRIKKQVEVMKMANEDYGVCYAHPEFMDDEGNKLDILQLENKMQLEGDVLEEYVLNKFRFVTPTSLIKASVYKKVGLYDERVLVEDYNFFLRALACFKVKYCDYPCIVYRIKRGGTLIFKKWNENKGERYYYDRILSNMEGLRFIKRKLVRTYIKKKIDQYIKSLAANNSRFFYRAVMHLTYKGYFAYSKKVFLIKFLRSWTVYLNKLRIMKASGGLNDIVY